MIATAPVSPDTRVSRTELSPLGFLARSAAVFPDKTAVVHGNRGASYSYRTFAGRVSRFATALRAAGLAPGDRVAVLCPNTPAMLEAHFAVSAAGGVLVTINTRLTATDVATLLAHSGARFLFVDSELLPLTRDAQPGLTIVPIADSGTPGDPFERFLATGDPDGSFEGPGHEEDPIAINYTSGTTGRPKGAVYTHRGAYLTALGNVIETGLSAESVFLFAQPLFHCNGWGFPAAVTAVAGTHICLRKVDPDLAWDLCDAHGVTHLTGAPTVHAMFVNHPKAHPFPRMARAIMGGAPPSPTLLARLAALNVRPAHFYGLTETYAPITVCDWRPEWASLPDAEQARLLARQGHGRIVAEPVRVVDETMADVPADGRTMGEVVMRGNVVMAGYYRDPEATAAACSGGWFHSGDLAVMHPDGAIELRDRTKDIVISGGENVSTIEVEQVITAHPAVLEAAVVAIPDDRWGERPKAFVTLKPGAEATERDILVFCRDRLAHFKCPAAVAFGELPKTATGKVQKFVLREHEWAGHDKRIH